MSNMDAHSATVRGGGRLEAHGLHLYRDGKLVLHDVSLQLSAGELLCVLGPNGAGKSTLLSAMAGELKLAPSDTVAINGRSIKSVGIAALAQMRAVLPQASNVQFDLPVREMVAMGAYPFNQLQAEVLDRLTDEALRMAAISYLNDKRYLKLSGGEQQRVQFARVLMQCLGALHIQSASNGRQHAKRLGRRLLPASAGSLHKLWAGTLGRSSSDPAEAEAPPKQNFFLLLDEPATALDPFHQRQLLKTVQKLTRQESVGALVILHDVNLAAVWSDRVALLKEGRLLACGSPSEVLNPACLHELYGISSRVIPHPHHPGRPLVVYE